MAMNVQFGNNGADGVFFFAASAGVDLSSFVGNGKLKFDMRLPPRRRQRAWSSRWTVFIPAVRVTSPLT